MAIIDRAAVRPPVLPKEAVQVDAIGGEVVVRGLLLSERLELSSMQRALRQPLAGESEEQAARRAGAAVVPVLLARAVLAGDGQPLFTEQQWQEFGSVHHGEATRLFDVAMRLAGHDGEAAEKN